MLSANKGADRYRKSGTDTLADVGRKFMDVDHIPAGVDFVGYLNSQVAACDVFLAVMAPIG